MDNNPVFTTLLSVSSLKAEYEKNIKVKKTSAVRQNSNYQIFFHFWKLEFV